MNDTTATLDHHDLPAREREHVLELRDLIEGMRERITIARQHGADPEGRLPRLHEGLASPIEVLFELRIKHRGGRYLWLQTAKTIGDAMGRPRRLPRPAVRPPRRRPVLRPRLARG